MQEGAGGAGVKSLDTNEIILVGGMMQYAKGGRNHLGYFWPSHPHRSNPPIASIVSFLPLVSPQIPDANTWRIARSTTLNCQDPQCTRRLASRASLGTSHTRTPHC